MRRRKPSARRGSPASASRTAIDRAEAARLLRTARAAAFDGDGDAIDWAFSAIPESVAVRRLKIEHALHHGDTDSADALIAQGLLLRPTNPSLTLLRARRLYAQGHVRRAKDELRLVLASRPHHCGALELSGRVAAELGDHATAVALLRQAAAERSGNDRATGLLVQSLLDAGYADRAAGALRTMAQPSSGLKARVLRGMGRLLEAREVLERAAAGDLPATDREAALCDLIDTLEEAGDYPRLRSVLESIGTDQPAVLAKAGRSWLLLGEFRTAALRMARLARSRANRDRALEVMVVAASMMDRVHLAELALRRLQLTATGIDAEAMAEGWRRGLMGPLLVDQKSPRRAGADPSSSRLGGLIQAAIDTFDEADDQAPPNGPGEPEPRSSLEHHRAACLAAMGTLSKSDPRPRRTPDEAGPEPQMPEPAP